MPTFWFNSIVAQVHTYLAAVHLRLLPRQGCDPLYVSIGLLRCRGEFMRMAEATVLTSPHGFAVVPDYRKVTARLRYARVSGVLLASRLLPRIQESGSNSADADLYPATSFYHQGKACLGGSNSADASHAFLLPNVTRLQRLRFAPKSNSESTGPAFETFHCCAKC